MLQKQTLLKIFSFFEDVIFFSGWFIFYYIIVFREILPFLSPPHSSKIDFSIKFNAIFCLFIGLLVFSIILSKFRTANIYTKLIYLALSALYFPIWIFISDLTSDWIYYLED